MASPKLRRLRHLLLAFALTGYGLWLAGSALWQLGRTAMFVHESVVVTGTVVDLRQKPFESWEETLGRGNWSMPGDVSYQPIVRFTLPGDIDAIRFDLDADNVDYRKGETVSIISPPGQPGKARINRWKFLWGASCLRLGIGTLISLIGYGLLCRLRGKGPAGASSATSPARRNASPQKAAASPAKPRAARKRKSPAADGSSPAPRRRKKAESSAAEGEAKAKKPRSRKKKSEPRQAELPF